MKHQKHIAITAGVNTSRVPVVATVFENLKLKDVTRIFYLGILLSKRDKLCKRK